MKRGGRLNYRRRPPRPSRWAGWPIAPADPGRLPRDRRDGAAQPVRVRIVDEAALDRARNRPCEFPGCRRPPPSDPHHAIRTKGARGNDTDDNLVACCREHHDLLQDGGEWARELCRRIIAARPPT